jgi:hypothetical protein
MHRLSKKVHVFFISGTTRNREIIAATPMPITPADVVIKMSAVFFFIYFTSNKERKLTLDK